MSHKISPPVYKVSVEHDVYKITSSRSKAKRLAFDVISIILFPIGLIRFIRYVMGKFVGKIVLPAQVLDSKSTIDSYRAATLKDTSCERVTIETADKVKLDTLKIFHRDQIDKPAQDQKWIVFFAPNGMTYEQLIPMARQIQKDTGANIYLGNYRGVGYSQSSPSCSQDLILDGEALVQYLHNHANVPYKNMVVHGWSLGGAVATEVAANHQTDGDCIKVCNERSFSSLFKEIKTLLPGGLFLAMLAHAVGWKFNPINRWKEIPEDNKLVIFHKKDLVVPYEAGLYKAVKDVKQPDSKKQQQTEKISLDNIQNRKPTNKIRLKEDYEPVHMVRLSEFSGYRNYLFKMSKWLEL